MNITAHLYNRDFSAMWIPPAGVLVPQRYSWHALGGPEFAEIKLIGSESQLWEAVEWLRCPVELYDERGDAVWWGYVAEVEIAIGAVAVGVSLDQMCNRIRVAYVRDISRAAALTAWVQDADSIAIYGTKEATDGLGGASDDMALEDAEKLLQERKYPVSTVQLRPGEVKHEATIRCRGWFDTLSWRYYEAVTTTNAAITTIIGSVVTAAGQFFSGTEIVDASTIQRSQYYDEMQTAREVIEELLRPGVASGNRLLATVTRNRALRVYQEPDRANASHYLDGDGRMASAWGLPLERHTCPVGMWVRLRDVIPASADVSRIADPSVVFIERSEYECATHRLTLEPRGMLSPWDLGDDEL